MYRLPMANTISVLPTADVPASASIQWSGYARAALVYNDTDIDWWDDGNGDGIVQNVGPDLLANDETISTGGDSLEIAARGQINLAATTDTAVGLVGVNIGLRANWDGITGNDAFMNEAWGYWQITPELTFGGGYAGSVGTVGHGGDIMTAMYSGGINAVGSSDATQFRVSYVSGPLSAAIALEDSDYGHADQDDVGVAAEVKYSGDMFSAEVAGFAHGGDWQVGAGVTANLSDMFKLSVAAGIGENENDSELFMTTLANQGTNTPGTVSTSIYDADYWTVSAVAVANLSDQFSVELGASYYEDEGSSSSLGATDIGTEIFAVAAGAYYTPVSQLTLGLEAGWRSQEAWDTTVLPGFADYYRDEESFTIDFVSVFRF
jgi:hypothetical protein